LICFIVQVLPSLNIPHYIDSVSTGYGYHHYYGQQEI